MNDESSATTREWDALRFVRLQCHQDGGDLTDWLAEDFFSDDPFNGEEREEYLASHRIHGPIEDLELVDVRCEGDAVTVTFEGTEWVTRLRRRICDVITFRGGRVVRVARSAEVVPPRP